MNASVLGMCCEQEKDDFQDKLEKVNIELVSENEALEEQNQAELEELRKFHAQLEEVSLLWLTRSSVPVHPARCRMTLYSGAGRCLNLGSSDRIKLRDWRTFRRDFRSSRCSCRCCQS